MRHQTNIEKAVVKSASVLFANPADAEKKLAATYDPLIDARADGAARRGEGDVRARGGDVEGAGHGAGAVGSREAGRAHGRGAQRAGRRSGAAAAAVVVRGGGGGGGGGRGGRGGVQSRIPGHMTGELNAVLGRGMTVLEIHDFISGEFEPVPLQDVWDYVKALETSGSVKLTTKTGK